MSKERRHHVEFIARKIVKEPTEVTFRTKSGERVDFVARKPAQEQIGVSFMARNKKRK